ncbi:MAG: ABC transporter permease [Ancalomicrobiaceae bacterium]|nr:ABC transporter permease [Ancalomicrobiaceae bacterium]
MRIDLIKRPEQSKVMAVASPLIAVALTLVTGLIIFAALGVPPLKGLWVYFIDPLTSSWSLQKLAIKASPLIMIAAGLAVSYRANVWNIGAEGQLTIGALFGSAIPILFNSWQSPLTIIAMLILGVIGGMLWGLIPALLKVKTGANEILTSLMLVYVAQLLLDWLVRGPWRDPNGHNFPMSVAFDGWQRLPTFGTTDVHYGVVLAVVAALALGVLMSKTLKGFEVRVLGTAPRAGAFAGFSPNRMVIFAFLVSGGLAGLAGICEIAGPGEILQPSISPGYGFTAIIVAFLGRLNPVGVIVAGLALGVSYLGGEEAHTVLGISDKAARVFQGLLLFYILACDTLILYRPQVSWRRPRVDAEVAQ